MVARGEIYWTDFDPPTGRRPAVVVTRSGVIRYLNAITVAPITRTVRDLASQVAVGEQEGLRGDSAINCDSLLTIRKFKLDPDPTGKLGGAKLRELDRALRFALGIRR